MGSEFGAVAEGAQVVMRGVGAAAEPWRFEREAADRWRGLTGDNAGEVLRVLRDPGGTVTHLDIATFVFGRDPSHLA